MKTSFGLDIGTKTFKAVLLQPDGNKFILKSCLSVALARNGMSSDSAFDLEEVAENIKKFVADANINVSTVHAALPDRSVYTKVVQIPVMAEKDLNSAIYWEAEQNIPAPLSTITLSWQILRKRESGAESVNDVLLVGAPTNIVKKYQHVLQMAGLKPESLEIEILSVIRSLNLIKTSPTTLVMHVSSYSTTLAIVEEGILSFLYAIPIGGTSMVRAVSTDFSITEEQAEQYMQTYGVTDQEIGKKIVNATDPILRSFNSEIHKMLTFYQDKFKSQISLKQVVVSGSLAEVAGVDVYLVRALGIETVIANPWQMRSIQNVPQQLLTAHIDYTTAVGLSLKDYV